MNRVAFPGFGLEFEINPTAFTIFGIDIQWYGIILSTGIVLAFLLLYYLAVKKEQIPPDSVYNVTLITVPVSIIGARIVYVLTRWDYYKDKSFFDMINLRAGGIAIYGAILFGLASLLLYNRFKKTSPLSMLDAFAPALLVGQIIGRWGNFVNAEAYGWSAGVENLPWRMEVGTVYIDGVADPSITCVHPTFLYESLWNLAGLMLILFVFYRKKKFNGEIFFIYMGWYGLGRACIEMLRSDSLYLFESLFGKTLKFSVVVGVLCVIASAIGLIVLSRRHKEEKEEISEYKSAFAAAAIAVRKEGDALDTSVFEAEAQNIAPEESEEELTDEGDQETLDEQDSLDALPNEEEKQDGEEK